MKKHRIWEILEISKENDSQSKIFDYFISILIGLNVVAIILETEKSIFGEYEKIFRYFETLSMIIFTLEYLLRMWSCTAVGEYREASFAERGSRRSDFFTGIKEAELDHSNR